MDRNTYNSIREKIEDLEKRLNGGKGSGNFGHAGRPGKIGGSAPESSSRAKRNKENIEKAREYASEASRGAVELADREAAESLGADLSDSGIEKGDRKDFWESVATQLETKDSSSDKDKVEKPKKKAKSTHDLSHTSDSVKKDYQKEFSQDELGEELNDFSYDDVLEALSNGKDVYDVFGIGDSVVREHVFQMLEKKTGIPYDEIYDAWTDNPRKLNERLTRSPRAYELKTRATDYFNTLNEKGSEAASSKRLTAKERDENSLRDMVHSVWAYDGDKEDNKYLYDPNSYTSLSAKERKKAIDDEWKYLDEHCTHPYADTDSEGVTYNRIAYTPSKAKKK